MTSEYNTAQRLLHKIKQSVSDFELDNGGNADVLQASIVTDLQTLSKKITEYRIIGRQDGNERKRRMMLDRASAMADEHEQLKRRYDKIKHHRTERNIYEEERGQLLQRRGDSGSRAQLDTTITMDPQDENAFWGRTEQTLDGYIAQGMASLDNLREQRGFLQNAHRKLLNATNTLGLSRSVITYINKRTTQDKIILICGMITTCVGIYFIIHYFG